MEILPMTEKFAREIACWRYPGEYAVYNMKEEDAEELMGYHALTEGGALLGFFCFGSAARIPLAEGYGEGPLDMGLGLAPSLCGQGRGRGFVQAGLDFARDRLGAKDIRLTVAAFNKRAIRVYEKLGFQVQKRVVHLGTGKDFLVMILKERHG